MQRRRPTREAEMASKRQRRSGSPGVRLKPNERCGPPSVKVTAEGEGSSPEEAVSKAAENARTFAGKLCHGKCDKSGESSVPCEYTETESVLAKPPAKIPDSNPVKYKAEVTSSGKCECQA
jgi:hypothetical protein